MKKSVLFAIGAGMMLAAAGGTAFGAATSTRHPLAAINPNWHIFSMMEAVTVECAPQGSDEFTTAAITNNTGATIKKGTTIYWADKYLNGATGAPKGHTALVQDVAPGQTALVGTTIAGRGYSCSAVFFELR